ncbi:MAG: chloride channel protein [Arachnia propionica]|uniref:chloride channel protein n=1 Tax=Arachnia propionica TaxID=1750 RepID=UPI0027011AA5|nr:chloride channel protein [Arachnia propionica]
MSSRTKHSPATAPLTGRLLTLSVGYGAVAGAVAAVTFLLMKGLEHLLWSHTDARWYVFLIVLLGGVVLASLVALAHAHFKPVLQTLLDKLGPGWRQTLVGSLLLAAFPLLRFSGHSDLHVIIEQTEHGAWWFLVAIAAGKVLATALSLASGWRGGEFFPLAFTGAAVGMACMAFVPGLDAGTAMVAGMAAATTVTLGKPLAVMLIVLLMVPAGALAPVAVAVLAGIATLRLSGYQPGHH